MRRIHKDGGLFVYMLADGRGAGLLTKVRGLALGQEDGLDTFDAYEALGVEPDPRSYDSVIAVLVDLGVTSVRLLTNNPRKILGLEDGGLEVLREPLEIPATEDSAAYLRAKRDKFGHLLSANLDEWPLSREDQGPKPTSGLSAPSMSAHTVLQTEGAEFAM